jgi:hypothetical protein
VGSAVGEGWLSFGSREIRKRKLHAADELDTKKRKCALAPWTKNLAPKIGASKGIWRGAAADPAKQRLWCTINSSDVVSSSEDDRHELVVS